MVTKGVFIVVVCPRVKCSAWWGQRVGEKVSGKVTPVNKLHLHVAKKQKNKQKRSLSHWLSSPPPLCALGRELCSGGRRQKTHTGLCSGNLSTELPWVGTFITASLSLPLLSLLSNNNKTANCKLLILCAATQTSR